MLNWINDVKDHLHLGAGKPEDPRLEERLSPEDAKRLQGLLESLYPKERMLAYKLMRYIERDLYPEAVLTARGMSFTPAKQNEINGALSRGKHREFLARLRTRNPGILRRFGEVALIHPCLEISFHQYPKPANPAEAWIGGILRNLDSIDHYAAMLEKGEPISWGLRLMADAARLGGQEPAIIVHCLLDWMRKGGSYKVRMFKRFPDLPEFLGDFAALVNGELGSAREIDLRLNLLELLGDRPEPVAIAPFEDGLLYCAQSGNRQVREKAELLLRVLGDKLRPRLESQLNAASADERLAAAQILGRFFPDDDGLRTLFTERQTVEKSSKVSELMTRYLAGTSLAPEPEEDASAVPSESRAEFDAQAAWKAITPAPLPPIPDLALPESVAPKIQTILEAADRQTDELLARIKKEHHFYHVTKRIAPSLKEIMAQLQSQGPVPEIVKSGLHHAGHQELIRFAALPEINLYHLVRWICLLSNAREAHWFLSRAEPFFVAFAQAHGPIDLRELARALKVAGLDPVMIGDSFMRQSRYHQLSLFRDRGEHLWPYFAENREVLWIAFGLAPAKKGQQDYYGEERRIPAYRVLASMPALPPELIPFIWEQALAGSKKERPLAQQALASLPTKLPQILAALQSGKQENRASAALWLAEIQDQGSVDALLAALKKEKQDVAKGAMFSALEKLGVPLESLLDRKQLAAEAKKAVAKGLPKDVQWLPVETLPAVRWDDGSPVDPAIIQHFIGQSVKLKSAEAPVMIAKYCELMNRADLAALGKFLLQAWLTQDTLPRHDAASAAAEAQKQVDQMKAWYRMMDEQAVYKSTYNRLLNDCLGSAAPSKGLLGLCACCCTGEVAASVYAYIKKWYGQRAAQCRALLVMLAHIPDRSAIQVLLTVGNRFRTKSIQEEARLQCQLLAEREGWTMDELADRTIPTAGFDEDGRQDLDFGPRQFTAFLREDFSIELETSGGKPVKNLPDPAQGDDAELAAAAKKALADSKKELKQVLKLQAERLYEAMCTQRSWRFEDWSAFINRHPIIGLYAQRLVWRVVAGAETASSVSFRPLADRSLTDSADDPVELPGDALIALAHESLVSAETAAAWTRHFKDYDVKPLIAQFGRGVYQVPESLREVRKIEDFTGHMLDAFTLRTQATKLGYLRGEGEDGGYFTTYTKDYVGIRLRAVINFTGNTLPEDNIRCALTDLIFLRLADPGQEYHYWTLAPQGLPLREVPPVLLSECYNDLKQIAAVGQGFEKDWKKKAGYG